MTSELHTAARDLITAYCCAILPLQPGGKDPIKGSRGSSDPIVNLAHVDTYWSACPNLNIGIACGMPSGLWVLDVDQKNGRNGEASLRALEEQYGPLPQTIEAITPSRGRHIYFRIGSLGTVPTTHSEIGGGLDVQSDGSYVCAPPSLRADGCYEWSVDSGNEFAEAPAWLIELARSKKVNGEGKSIADWHSVLSGPIHDGTRDDTMASIAGKLLRAQQDGLDTLLIYDLLMCVNDARCVPPIPAEDVERITRSIATAHIRSNSTQRKWKPRHG